MLTTAVFRSKLSTKPQGVLPIVPFKSLALALHLPGYENDILAHQFMEHGEGGPDRRLTLQDVWEVHMPTQ